MLVLDTDHFSEWERGSIAGSRLRARVEPSRPAISVSIVTVEEQMRGWLAEISRQRDLHRQIIAYAKLQRQVEAFADWVILPWNSDSAKLFLNSGAKGSGSARWI